MFRQLVEQVRHFNQYRSVYTQLSRMTTRELADIGLSRCDIEEVARGRRH